MRRLLLIAASCTLLTLQSSCVSGWVFHRVVEPLDTNFNETPVGGDAKRGSTKRVTVQYVDVQWDSNGIGEIGKEHGLEEVYFADVETLRILGIWRQRWVHVYGR